MRALPVSLLVVTACGSKAAAPAPAAPEPTPPPRVELGVFAASCMPAAEAPRPDPTSMRGVFGREATTRIGVAALVAGEAPAVHVPVGDGELVCRPAYAPACTHVEADRLELVDASGEVQLGFLRDETGAPRPIAWYRTVVDGFAAPVD